MGLKQLVTHKVYGPKKDEIGNLRYYMGTVCKVHGLTLLLQVRTLCTCDVFFFKVHPLASNVLLTTPHPLLENVNRVVK